MLEKLVLLILVLYAIACHAVTKYCVTWCSVVIHVMFNTVKLLYVVFEKTDKNKPMWENYRCGKVIYFKLFMKNCMKIITMG
jgi:hypothetical protein